MKSSPCLSQTNICSSCCIYTSIHGQKSPLQYTLVCIQRTRKLGRFSFYFARFLNYSSRFISELVFFTLVGTLKFGKLIVLRKRTVVALLVLAYMNSDLTSIKIASSYFLHYTSLGRMFPLVQSSHIFRRYKRSLPPFHQKQNFDPYKSWHIDSCYAFFFASFSAILIHFSELTGHSVLNRSLAI